MICCSLTSRGREEAAQDMQFVRGRADVIEIRLDYFEEPSSDDISYLLDRKPCALLFTCRSKAEGGRFSGSEKERIALLKECISLGADYVDIEWSSGASEVSSFVKMEKSTKIIVSSHHFEQFPSDLDSVYASLKSSKADIIKIASMADSLSDNLVLFDLLKRAKKESVSMIGIAMGEKGEISRVLNVAYGSYLTYGSLARGKETAPGQIPIEHLKKAYRVSSLKPEGLKVYGLVGNPVSKSRGFLLHNLLFKEEGINAVYLNFLVDDIDAFVSDFRDFFDGLSVTMPFKSSIVSSLDELDPLAQKIGAVNTVVKKKGKLVGYNTDAQGALDALLEKTSLQGKKVVLLGAGGTARAIGYALVGKVSELMIVNRSADKGEELAKELGAVHAFLSSIDWKSVDILINATSVGMSPRIHDMPIDRKYLDRLIVFDVIYNPLVTKLLHEAERMRCKTVSGLSLFVAQAAHQFTLWTGKKADPLFMEDCVLQYMVE